MIKWLPMLLFMVVAPVQASLSRSALERHADLAAIRYGVPAETLKAICGRESSWNPNAVGPVGEIGLCQLRPQTVALMKGPNWRSDLTEAQRIKLIEKELFDPKANLAWAAKYLRWMIREAKGDMSLAIAAYNAGPGVIRYVNRVKDSIVAYAPPSVAPDTGSVAAPLAANDIISVSN